MSKSDRQTKLVSLISKRRHSKKAKFDIDVVVLWCEDSPEHKELREEAEGKLDGTIDNCDKRFACHDELKWCLRSIAWCLPWVRRVHVVVADYQFPSEFVDPSKGCPENWPEMRVIPHSEFMPATALPCFNSQAIESRLHRIPGLANHFIYANDDFGFGVPVPSDIFFNSKTGAPVYHFDDAMVCTGKKTRRMSMHSRAWCNNSKMLDILFGEDARHYPAHVAVPMLRESFAEAWSQPQSKSVLRRTLMSKFRKGHNLYLIGLLVYWNIYKHGAHQRPSAKMCFSHNVTREDSGRDIGKFVLETQPPLFCINDDGMIPADAKIISGFMKQMFPLKSPWEPSRLH